jgi:hypothetical protein
MYRRRTVEFLIYYIFIPCNRTCSVPGPVHVYTHLTPEFDFIFIARRGGILMFFELQYFSPCIESPKVSKAALQVYRYVCVHLYDMYVCLPVYTCHILPTYECRLFTIESKHNPPCCRSIPLFLL